MDNFLTRLFRREASKPATTTATVEQVVVADHSTVEVSSYVQAEKIAAAYACANVLASTVAKLPLEYKRKNYARGIFVDYEESLLFYLLSTRPSKWHTAYDFWYTATYQMKMLGNAYAYIDRSGFDVYQLILLSPHTCNYDESSDTYSVMDQVHGVFGNFSPSEILHFSNGNISGGRLGKSAITYGAEVLGIQAAADREVKKRFESGGRIKAIYTNDTSVKGFGNYADGALDNNAKDVQRKLRSGEDIISMPGDGKIQPLSMTSTDMEILGNKKFGIREICRCYGVPPSKIYDDYNHAYNAGETENISFLIDSIEPLLTKLEQELSVKLLGDNLVVAKNYRILFDREKMFTVNSISKADYYTKMLATGAVTVNDLRRRENKETVEGGDVAMITCNVAPITSAKITGEEKSGQPLLEKTPKE